MSHKIKILIITTFLTLYIAASELEARMKDIPAVYESVIKESYKLPAHIITFKVSKDKMFYTDDLLTFDIIVSEDYYNSLTIGDIFIDTMNIGPLELFGLYGRPYIFVFDKRIER